MRAGRSLASALLTGILLTTGTMPAVAADRDNDGLRDTFEAKRGVTDPDVQDSDHDGVIDSAEDSDGDGVPDGAEDDDRDGRRNARERDQRRLPAGLKPKLDRARKDGPPIKLWLQPTVGG